jgi:hypothetical protein
MSHDELRRHLRDDGVAVASQEGCPSPDAFRERETGKRIEDSPAIVQITGKPISHAVKKGFNTLRGSWASAGFPVSARDDGGAVPTSIFTSVARFVCKILPVFLLRHLFPTRSRSSDISPALPAAEGVAHPLQSIPSVIPKPFPFLPLAFSLSRRSFIFSALLPSNSLAAGVGHPESCAATERFSPPSRAVSLTPVSLQVGLGHPQRCATRGSMSKRFRVDPSGLVPVVAIPGESL